MTIQSQEMRIECVTVKYSLASSISFNIGKTQEKMPYVITAENCYTSWLISWHHFYLEFIKLEESTIELSYRVKGKFLPAPHVQLVYSKALYLISFLWLLSILLAILYEWYEPLFYRLLNQDTVWNLYKKYQSKR